MIEHANKNTNASNIVILLFYYFIILGCCKQGSTNFLKKNPREITSLLFLHQTGQTKGATAVQVFSADAFGFIWHFR